MIPVKVNKIGLCWRVLTCVLPGGGSRPRRIIVTHVKGPTLHAAKYVIALCLLVSVPFAHVTRERLPAGLERSYHAAYLHT